jgi:hypothetical protein
MSRDLCIRIIKCIISVRSDKCHRGAVLDEFSTLVRDMSGWAFWVVTLRVRHFLRASMCVTAKISLTTLIPNDIVAIDLQRLRNGF